MQHVVPGYGPTNRPIVVVGEAPGEMELASKIPFVGPAGKLLRQALQAAGFNPNEVRYENVIEYKQSPDALYQDAKKEILSDEGHYWFTNLEHRLRGLCPTGIIACGALALHATTGLTGIQTYQCTPCRTASGTSVMPTLHPAYILRDPGSYPWLAFGCKKAKAYFAGETYKEPTYITAPTCDTSLGFIYACAGQPTCIDLETRADQITCIGIACGSKAISIPFTQPFGSYYSEAEEYEIWSALDTRLFRSDTTPKVFQNIIFDAIQLRRRGFTLAGPLEDTMLMAWLLHPELEKGLDSLAKLYTFAPPWKHKVNHKTAVNSSDLWLYNAKDAAVTLEIYNTLKAHLQKANLFNFYETRTKALIPPVIEICATGVAVDHAALAEVRDEALDLAKAITVRLREITHNPDFLPTSPAQVKEHLRNLKIKIPTKDGEETTDALALKKLMVKYPNEPFLSNLAEHRKVQKLSSSYANVQLDEDKRLRFRLNIAGTISGRFSSAKTDWDTGLNIQNIPKNFRRMIVPDPGCTFIQIDLKQAESRVVAWLAREETMSRLFDAEADLHVHTANKIFGTDITKLPKDDYTKKRFMGKKANHSFNYGKGPRTFIDDVFKESGFVITLAESEKIHSGYFATYPRIVEWQKAIQRELYRSRRLVSPHGRVCHFTGFLNDDTFRDAYSFIPQATVVDYLNEAWLKFEKLKLPGVRVCQQGHDSLLIEAPTNLIDQTTIQLTAAFDVTTVTIYNQERRIPYDIGTGSNWGSID